jgi:ribose 5-phosphate isomerase B
MKIIGIACDHAGYELKEILKSWLKVKGFELKDFGAFSHESSDYADFAHPIAHSIENGEATIGITICGSGNGINMTVNKHQGIRAGVCWNKEVSRLARAHNNANICSLPARFVSVDEAKEIVETFINTEFEGGRHQTRIEKIPVNNI